MGHKYKITGLENDRFIDDLIMEAAQTWLSKKENKEDASKYKYKPTQKYQNKKNELAYLPKNFFKTSYL